MRRLFASVVLLAVAAFAVAAPGSPQRHTYPGGDGRPLGAYVFAPAASKKPAPAVLLFHPGGWRAGEAAWEFDDAKRFARLGLVAIAVDYRLAKDGRTPVDSLADTCAAFDWVRRNAKSLHIDATRIAGYGDSAGGELVAAAGTERCPSKLLGPDIMLLVSPVLDVEHDEFVTMLRSPSDARDASPLAHAGVGMAPALVIQGDADTRSPLAPAQAFCERARAAGIDCELARFAGVGHLLTRDLQHQEENIDPAPADVAESERRQREFLRRHGYLTTRKASAP